MIQRLITLMLGIVFAASSNALADQKLSGKPQAGEVAFVTGIQKDLMARFPTAQDAEKAGYFRFTNEDKTGAISYVNLTWESADPQHPSQLWYDAKGKLIGADFSVAKSAAKPKLWGVNPERWDEIESHVHYVLVDAAGKETYKGAHLKDFVAAGGDAKNPQAETVVKMGKATDAASVKHIFAFPDIWDLQVWVVPNPDGAFAEYNPNVKKKAADSSGSM